MGNNFWIILLLFSVVFPASYLFMNFRDPVRKCDAIIMKTRMKGAWHRYLIPFCTKKQPTSYLSFISYIIALFHFVAILALCIAYWISRDTVLGAFLRGDIYKIYGLSLFTLLLLYIIVLICIHATCAWQRIKKGYKYDDILNEETWATHLEQAKKLGHDEEKKI